MVSDGYRAVDGYDNDADDDRNKAGDGGGSLALPVLLTFGRWVGSSSSEVRVLSAMVQ